MFIEQILGITTGFFEWPLVGLKAPLDVIRESFRKVVGSVPRDKDLILHMLKVYQANAETELFKVLRDALQAERGQQDESSHRAGHAVKVVPSNPYHIISPETTLLEKIRDIRD
ncbi:Mg2+ transporter like zinc transport [Fusarium pseudocircinatum]|uniref:Mg2+ transporter like zinc transport n=1 Tax=Fusarium pseudocircinatum TaxID=56676 RepID=A0A8H5KIP6_9HYPO|nr:Mg2+ transporter like zinc transport [Fusarium pseudocircinatum]